MILVSQHTEFDSSLGRGFLVSPAGCFTLPSPFCPPAKFVGFGSHLRGNVRGLEQLGEKSRGENVGQLSLAELQLCHLEMETALVTSGNDIPSTHPAPGLSRTKGLLWSRGTGLGQS